MRIFWPSRNYSDGPLTLEPPAYITWSTPRTSRRTAVLLASLRANEPDIAPVVIDAMTSSQWDPSVDTRSIRDLVGNTDTFGEVLNPDDAVSLCPPSSDGRSGVPGQRRNRAQSEPHRHRPDKGHRQRDVSRRGHARRNQVEPNPRRAPRTSIRSRTPGPRPRPESS